MKRSLLRCAGGLLAILVLNAAPAAAEAPADAVADNPRGPWRTVPLHESARAAEEPRASEQLEKSLQEAVLSAVEQTGASWTTEDEVWATVIDVRDPWAPRIGSYQGSELVYPASVIKICYMVAAYDQNRTMGLPLDDAMREDLRDMIVVSGNKATNRVLDRVTNTGFGPELEGEALEAFLHKRDLLRDYFESIGLPNLDPGMKTFSGDIRLYGRDRQQLGDRAGDNYEGSNMMATDDTAKLLYLIWRGALVDREACEEMLEIMRRGEEHPTYLSAATPEGGTLYSKSGWTGRTRHDAGIYALPEGGAIIVVVFTKIRDLPEGEDSPKVIEAVAESMLKSMRDQPGMPDQATADESAALNRLGENSR